MRQHKVKSFDKFVDGLQEVQPVHILVAAHSYRKRTFLDQVGRLTIPKGPVGELGMVGHGLVYTVYEALRTRRFREELFQAFQSEYGFGDENVRWRRFASVALAGETRVEQLQVALPNTLIQLCDADELTPASSEALDALHAFAEEEGIKSALELTSVPR